MGVQLKQSRPTHPSCVFAPSGPSVDSGLPLHSTCFTRLMDLAPHSFLDKDCHPLGSWKTPTPSTRGVKEKASSPLPQNPAVPSTTEVSLQGGLTGGHQAWEKVTAHRDGHPLVQGDRSTQKIFTGMQSSVLCRHLDYWDFLSDVPLVTHQGPQGSHRLLPDRTPQPSGGRCK